MPLTCLIFTNKNSISRIFGIFITFVFTFTNAYSQANLYQQVGDPIVTIYSVEEHQSGNQIWAVTQYIDDRMLFATGNGLSSWDGENWYIASTPNSTRIRDLTVWKDNNIYAGAVGELGFFKPLGTGEFAFNQIETQHLIDDFGQTRGVNSNQDMVLYSTDQAVFMWDGKQLQIIKNLNARGSRVFKIKDTLLVSDRQHLYSISLNDGKPLVSKLPWQFPKNVRIKSLFVNQLHQIIMITNMQGMFVLQDNLFVNVITPEELPINQINSGMQGNDGFYYLNSTIDGLMIYSSTFELLRHYKHNDGIGMSTVISIFQDKQQSIWLGGLPNISVFQPPHLNSQYRSDTGTVDFENIYNIDEDMFFSGTGIYQLKHSFGKTRSPMFIQVPDFNLVVLDMIAIEDEILVATEAGVYLFDWVDNNMSSPKLISSQDFVTRLVYSKKHKYLYATIGNHLSQFEKVQGKWRERKLVEDNSGMENLMVKSLDAKRHEVWFSSEQQELFRIVVDSTNTDELSLTYFDKQSAPLGNEHLIPFVYDNRVLIGTENGVIEYQPNENSYFAPALDFPLSLRTASKDVFKVLIDDKARIWYHAGRESGVAYLDDTGQLTSHEALFSPYNRSGIRGISYFDHSIWFGVASGNVYRLSEKLINNQPTAVSSSIQYIKSVNQNVKLNLRPDIIELAIEDNSIRIGFSLPDYSTPLTTQFRTKLLGGAKQNWTQWSNEASKDFTLLAGGDYTLLVEATDPYKRLSSTHLDFAVAFPWYLSVEAKIVYLLLLLTLTLGSIKVGHNIRNKALLLQNKELEVNVDLRTIEISQKIDELKQQQDLKDRFLGNVSHEFRTPLTLTIGPLETLLKEGGDSLRPKHKDLTVTALSNAKKMLALVGQVLDINRLDVGRLSLRVAKHDISSLLRDNRDRFMPWAQQNSQHIICVNCENPYQIYCDLDQIDKCITNLLSNAIKYSGNGSRISITLVPTEQTLGIRIADDGHGILAANQHLVFDRFYQETPSFDANVQGYGIGLSIVKELVELHHGSIELETDINKGCQFTLWFPHGTSHFKQDELIESTFEEESLHLEKMDGTGVSHQHTKVLVVDDNAELRDFICQRLESNFIIFEASDGLTGYHSAIENLPDVIISDITMPVMSGLVLTRKLKEHSDTSNIPILLLSAQTTKRDIVSGFANGADDYLIKPFDTSELIMRIKTLISNRIYKEQQNTSQSDELDTSANETLSFEQCIQKIILENFSDSTFNINTLAQLMFISKQTLRRKCKVKLMASPSVQILDVRIQNARQILKKGEMNVSQVAYATGFDSLAYFSKTFKKYHKVSPSTYLKRNTKSVRV
ncbi:MAG: signal transduction histidine kinase/DNA-binding response OmpR family regulator [Paraglaciecola sp.]